MHHLFYRHHYRFFGGDPPPTPTPPPPPAPPPEPDEDELERQRRALERNRRGRESLVIPGDPGIRSSPSPGLRIP